MSFLYCFAKQVMMGRRAVGGETWNISLTTSGSIFAALIKSSYDVSGSPPGPQVASTTGSFRSVFAQRVQNAASASALADVALAANEISSSNGITFFDANDIAFVSVSTGQIIHGILIYQRITDDSDSMPIAFINVSTVTSNGASINVNWDNGVNRIFSLT